MVVRFSWESREWREAYLLCSRKAKQASDPVPMGFLVVGVMLAGGMGDLYQSLKHSRGAILHDRLLPVLVLVCAVAPVAAAVLALLRHRRRFHELPAMPEGEQQVTFHELGWNAFATSRDTEAPVRPWSEVYGHRSGRNVLAILTSDGTPTGLPLRALTAGQNGWLEQIIDRKRSSPCDRLGEGAAACAIPDA